MSPAAPTSGPSSPFQPSPTHAQAGSTLPSSHPLISELVSLRQQLAAYQRAAHQAGISLQGARLELALSRGDAEKSRRQGAELKKEVELLRNNPAPPPLAPTSTALTQLSLAHRRLSSKLDLTESQLTSSQLDLAKAQQEVQRLTREREGDRAVLNELKRIEEDREEELEWEKGEKRKALEQKKLCDLALDEYRTLVHSLDPNAVPPETPSKPARSLFQAPTLMRSPDLDGTDDEGDLVETATKPSSVATTAEPMTPSDAISNLLIGQKGVHQLFNDLTGMLVSKDKTISTLETKVEEVEYSLKVAHEQLTAETAQRVEAESDRDKALRDDASASRVVERYMTFTQKTHATVHMHLDNLRARSGATVATLRSEVARLKQKLVTERDRSRKLQEALDELSEGMSREAAGRRRETALRLKMLAVEEKRSRKVENWLDRVRRMREGAEGAVAEPDTLQSLLDEGVEAVADGADPGETLDPSIKEKQRSWRGLGLLGKKDKNRSSAKASGPVIASTPDRIELAQEESLARILLAEELVTTLVADLQVETEKRMELERQRVEWLAKEAADGVEAKQAHDDEDDSNGHVMFDLEAEDPEEIKPDVEEELAEQVQVDTSDIPLEASTTPASTSLQPPAEITHDETVTGPPRPLTPEPTPLAAQLSELFAPLTDRYMPLQKDLHDLSHALVNLRSTLPSQDSPLPPSPKQIKKSTFLTLSRRPRADAPASDPALLAILDGIHEVIEDARVDVEIALADHERVYRGFEALLNVGKGKEKREVMDEVREYLDVKGGEEDEGWKRLKRRVGEVENDLAEVKRVIHESEGMQVASWHDAEDDPEHPPNSSGPTERRKSVWDTLALKTVSAPIRASAPWYSPTSSPLGSPLSEGLPSSSSVNGIPSSGLDPRRRTSNMLSTVGSVGRSFSNSVIGAPRRVSGLASGLYKGPNGLIRRDEEKDGLVKRFDEEDDVE
ncbi:hypothetical protein IAU60_005519 [Kwoniella sp. DSM 27419]